MRQIMKKIIVFLFVLGVCMNSGEKSSAQNSDQDSRLLTAPIQLRNGWAVQSSALVKEEGNVISTGHYVSNDWYPTSVPATVLSTLIKNGVYPDMRVGLNTYQIPDSSDRFNEKHDLAQFSHLPGKRNPWIDPYWYRTEFTLPESNQKNHIWLHFNTINYRADVWLNGTQIGDHQQVYGIFQRYDFDITGTAHPGTNHLAVKIYPADHPAEPDTQFEVFGPPRDYQKEIMKDLTMVFSIGYDCMPTVPDRNMGILQDVYIDYSGPVDIRHPFVITDLPLPQTDQAFLKVSADLLNLTKESQKGILKGVIAEDGLTFEQPVELAPGEIRTVVFEPAPVINNPRLWWPNHYGEPNLYTLSLTFEQDNKITDRKNTTFGVREITKVLHELDGSHGLQLHINGQKIFCRGGYIQPEIQLDWDRQRMETEIRYFTQANLNLVYFEDIPSPPDEFLDLCDRYGLMFGNCFYGCYWMRPGTGYPSDTEKLAAGTRDIIKRHRNHPSLVLYMAMNENDTREDVYEMWRDQVISLDGTRIFIPSAHFPDSRKDAPVWIQKDMPVGMTDIGASYTWKEPSDYYRFVRENRNWMFMMESGSASLPPIDSLRKFIPDLGENSTPDLFPLNRTWAHHGANSYYKDYDRAVRRIYGPPQSVADYCWKGHLATADQHRAMFEAVNHRMWDITSGFTQWKINSCWPSVQWQIFDWYLKPMVSYYFIKKACEPLHIQLDLIDAMVTVVNNRLEPQTGLKVEARLFDFHMNLRWEKSQVITIGSNSYTNVFGIPPISDITPIFFVKLELKDSQGKSLSDNFYWLSSSPPYDFTALQRLPRVKLDLSYDLQKRENGNAVRVTVKNPSGSLAFFVHLAVTDQETKEEIVPVFWDDNYFSLLPGETKVITAAFPFGRFNDLNPSLEAGGWNIQSEYQCMNLNVSSNRVKMNETFAVTAEIADTFIDGSAVDLFVDGRPADSKLVWARAGVNEKVEFTLTLNTPGVHEIQIGKLSASITVDQ